MSSRFASYQKSFQSFLSKNSCIAKNKYKDELLKLSNNSDFILPIAFLTIINNRQKKHRPKIFNGYELAAGIELLLSFCRLLECDKNLNNYMSNTSHIQPSNNKNIEHLHLQPIIISLIHSALINNISMIDVSSIQEYNKIILSCHEHLNEHITSIISFFEAFEFPDSKKTITKSDLEKFHFGENLSISKIHNIKQLTSDFILNYITSTYGSICKLLFIFGWLLGGGENINPTNIEKFSSYFAIIIKLAYDFRDLDKDIEKLSKNGFTLNYVLNFGLQNSFELFETNKCKFNEFMLSLDIRTPTVKEFVDILESHVNKTIEKSSPELSNSIPI